MSRRAVKKPRKISKRKRQVVAQKIGQSFNRLNPKEKRDFADQTLTALMSMSSKQLSKLFGRFIKRGRPSRKDLETVNQLVIVFLYSVKEEFRYHYATMIYKRLSQARTDIEMPPDLPKKVEMVRQLDFIHAGVSPEMYEKLFGLWEKYGVKTFDEFFQTLLSNPESGKK